MVASYMERTLLFPRDFLLPLPKRVPLAYIFPEVSHSSVSMIQSRGIVGQPRFCKQPLETSVHLGHTLLERSNGINRIQRRAHCVLRVFGSNGGFRVQMMAG